MLANKLLTKDAIKTWSYTVFYTHKNKALSKCGNDQMKGLDIGMLIKKNLKKTPSPLPGKTHHSACGGSRLYNSC